MKGSDRRKKLVEILKKSDKPVSGTSLSKELTVSRQVIVQDITLLRSAGMDIISTHRGYVLNKTDGYERIFKVIHEDEDVERELSLIVDLGGRVKDVFIYHKVYGVVRAEMNICSRRDVKNYLEEIRNGKSSLLKNVTSGYHYHTVAADSELILDIIQDELKKAGFLAKLQDYEPVDFWDEQSSKESK